MIRSASCPDFAAPFTRRSWPGAAIPIAASCLTPAGAPNRTTGGSNTGARRTGTITTAFPTHLPQLNDAAALNWMVELPARVAQQASDQLRDLGNEIEVESTLHVAWLQTAPEVFDDELAGLRPPPAGAPTPASSSIQPAHPLSLQNLSRTWIESPKALAACLVTPSEAPVEQMEQETLSKGRSLARLAMNLSNRATAAAGACEMAFAESVEEAVMASEAATKGSRWIDWVRRLKRRRMAENLKMMLSKIKDLPMAPAIGLITMDSK